MAFFMFLTSSLYQGAGQLPGPTPLLLLPPLNALTIARDFVGGFPIRKHHVIATGPTVDKLAVAVPDLENIEAVPAPCALPLRSSAGSREVLGNEL